MREIKFRAWDTETKVWYVPTHEAYKGNLFELVISFSGDLSANTMDGLVHQSMWPDRFKLMQFTGLLDKNVKEIYEGDIVRKSYGVGYATDRYPSFVSGTQAVSIHVIEWSDSWMGFRQLAEPMDSNFSRELEVLGNVHEHPELLKSNK